MTDGPTRESWRLERSDEGLWTLWFDAPGRSHNVLDPAAFEGLDGYLAEVEGAGESTLRGLLVRSGKPAGFCAGADLKTIRACPSPFELQAYLSRGMAVLDRLSGLKVPTAAVVHGICLGGGLELALACRFRVAIASNVPLKLGSPEVQLGLIPAWGAIARLPRLLAPRDALNLLLGGNPIGFLHAKSQGLVDRLFTQDEHEKIGEMMTREAPPPRPFTPDPWLEELRFARAKAADQSADFPEAQEAIMEVIEADLARGPDAARQMAIARCVELAGRPESREAIDAFFNRRQVST
jgi:3-hydroxyacyl-CoA dehydrogenase/enoyl-CoA hydratase/3-hydroxybutyryl-CoA epimerase